MNGTVNFSIINGPNAGSTNATKNTVSGTASFTYTSNVAGTDVIRAIASALGNTATATVTRVWIAGACPTITLAPGTLPDGAVGAAYSQTITATGGTPPRSFAVTAGTPPSGPNLSSAGTLSGTPSGEGASGFTVTATDANSCTGSLDYVLTINAAPPEPHDLAVLQLKAPKKVTLKAGTAPKPGKVSVTIANLGTLTETFPTMQSVLNVVNLNIESLGTNCVAPTAVLQPLKSIPVILAPKKKLKLTYLVTIDCANDVAAGLGHEDYRFTASVNHAALDRNADTMPVNDNCPHPPNAATGDKGCGNKDAATGQLGADVKTDVFIK